MKKIFVKPVCFLAVLTLVICSLGVFPTKAYAEGGQADFTQYLPVPKGTSWYFDRPQGLATDRYGNIYVAETHDYRIHKMNSNGETIVKWGTPGKGDGQFDYVTDVDVDQNGLVYVLDSFVGDISGDSEETTGSRVQVFDSNGAFLRKWEFVASEDERPCLCNALALDGSGNVYITGGSKVYKFDNDGNPTDQWGGQGTADGQFEGARGIAVDKSGYVYVVDSSGRIQKFDGEGSFIKKWGSRGSGYGQFDLIWGVAVDNLGYVYVTDTDRGTIQKFDSNGKFIKRWGHIGNPRMFETYAVAADDFGNIYAGDNLSIFKFSSNGTYLARWGSVSQSSSMFFYAEDVAIDSHDNLYVLDRNNYRIQKFDKAGKYITKWSTVKPGETREFPQAIAIDSQDNVYVINTFYPRVYVFDSSGHFIKSWGKEGYGNGLFYEETGGMDFDEEDNLYIADKFNDQVQVFTKDGEFIRALGSNNHDYTILDTELSSPNDVKVGPDGLIYVVSSYSRTVKVFDKEGNFIRKFGSRGTGDGQMEFPYGITCDKNGNVYVADYDNHRIQEFDSEGNFIAKWGRRGSGTINEFKHPVKLEFDSMGNLYVADSSNSRIMRKPAEGGLLPNIEYVSLENTSPILGFVPGSSNRMPIEVSVTSEQQAELSAYVFNSSGKWVAKIGATVTESGEYSFDWDGRATKGNTAGLAAGKLVPSSSSGTKYKIRAFVQNENGSDWSTIQTIKFYSGSKVKWVGITSSRITKDQTATFTYKIAHYSDVEVRILDSKSNIAAKYSISDVFPNRNISITWDGKATEGNTLGLSPGSVVPTDIYTVQIIAGNTLYNASNKIFVLLSKIDLEKYM